MNCGTCKNWDLVGELGRQGFGQCEARPMPIRLAITTSPQNVCRIGKFAKAPSKTVREREHAGGTLL